MNAQKKLLAKPCPPSAPSRNHLIFVFQQLFAEGECLSRLLPEVSCSSLGLGRAGDETPRLVQVAGGWGAVAIEDLNLSALLMTSAGISMGEFLFS